MATLEAALSSDDCGNRAFGARHASNTVYYSIHVRLYIGCYTVQEIMQ